MSQEDISIIQSDAGVVADVRSMITQTRAGVAQVVQPRHYPPLLAHRQADPDGSPWQ